MSGVNRPELSIGLSGSLARLQARVIVGLRWMIVPAWLLASAYVLSHSTGSAANGPGVVSLVPPGSAALKVADREQRLFPVPFEAESEVVQASPRGLSAAAQARSLALALRVDRPALSHPRSARVLAVPIPNTFKLAPGSRRSGTAIVTYLEYPPSLPAEAVTQSATRYGSVLKRQSGDVVGITGIIPAEWHEGLLIQHALLLVEAVTVAIIALLVGLRFRSFGSALLTLLSVGIANLCSDQALTWLQTLGGVTVPGFVQPLQIALVLGIGTDYCVFYLSGMQPLLGGDRVAVARTVSGETTPIVAAGGVIMAASLASLVAAPLAFFRSLGPSLALTVMVTLAVAATFVPAMMALFGGVLFWPWGRQPSPEPRETDPAPRISRRARLMVRRSVAFLIVLVCCGGLGVCAAQLSHLRVGFTEITGLPVGSEERAAYSALSQNFAPGMLSPTTVVVSGRGVDPANSRLVRLQSELSNQPGVAAVIGPADQPSGRQLGLIYAPARDAARYILVLNTDPLGAAGLHDIARLRSELPRLLTAAGLTGSGYGVTGDTAVAQETTASMRQSLLTIVPLVLLVNTVLLGLYLRSVLAPILLVAASALSVTAAIGLATWVFAELLGYGELTYYVPYASAILLISLASDYNAYVTGRIWQAARTRPIHEAIALTAPRTAHAVRTAGVILTASFAVIALIPIRGFREFAFTMAVGIVLETFVVRSLLVPSIFSLVGDVLLWPQRPASQPVNGPSATPSVAKD